ncbi:DUF7573 domain-containing protein [Halosimplex sp. J119]
MGNRSLDDFAGGGESDGSPDESADAADEPGASAAESGDPVGSSVDDDASDASDSEGDASSEETSGGDAETDTSEDSSESDGPPVSATAVEPAVSTYTWSGDGGVCDACGETVDRRWRQDDDLVCPDCKDW